MNCNKRGCETPNSACALGRKSLRNDNGVKGQHPQKGKRERRKRDKFSKREIGKAGKGTNPSKGKKGGQGKGQNSQREMRKARKRTNPPEGK